MPNYACHDNQSLSTWRKTEDWLLHMYAVNRIIPNFFNEKHWNNSRYIHDMYIKWNHHYHKQCYKENMFAGIKIDSGMQFFSTSLENKHIYIRYGNSKAGLVRKSLSAGLMSEWILSHHLYNTLSMLMDSWNEQHEAGESVMFLQTRGYTP